VEGRKSIKNQNQKVTGLCLVFPRRWRQHSKAVSIRLADLIRIVEPSSERILVITSKGVAQELGFDKSSHDKEIQFAGSVECSDSSFILIRILGELRAQLQISRTLLSISDSTQIVFWRGRWSTYVLPLLVAKLKGKKSILLVESRASQSVRKLHKGPLGIEGFVLSQLFKVIEKVAFSFLDMLVVNVPSLLREPWLNKYKSKVFPYPVPGRFVRPEFHVRKPLDQRRTLIGYIGRMSWEKGVLNLAGAIPLICKEISNVEFLFDGDGPLLEQVRSKLTDLPSHAKAEAAGWIAYDGIPDHLNQMKLLVLPSYNEGLPAIVLEAMACGTPVLATPVGAIPDIITDGENGFIMEDNTPECIAKNIIRALTYPSLGQVSENAHAFVEARYSYETVVERYRDMFNGLNVKEHTRGS
jgi:glycosyltransferase involved in cell wall biosynthesis